ncbi:MAG TPA: LLM class F420-dependent oxidoreductase, partial [Nakamurella sp.]
GFADLDVVTAQNERVRLACEAAGRDPASLTYSTAQVLCVGVDQAEQQRRAARLGGFAAMAVDSACAGTVDQVTDTLGTWAAAGVQRVYLQVIDLSDLEQIAVVAEQILPAVRNL